MVMMTKPDLGTLLGFASYFQLHYDLSSKPAMTIKQARRHHYEEIERVGIHPRARGFIPGQLVPNDVGRVLG